MGHGTTLMQFTHIDYVDGAEIRPYPDLHIIRAMRDACVKYDIVM